MIWLFITFQKMLSAIVINGQYKEKCWLLQKPSHIGWCPTAEGCPAYNLQTLYIKDAKKDG